MWLIKFYLKAVVINNYKKLIFVKCFAAYTYINSLNSHKFELVGLDQSFLLHDISDHMLTLENPEFPHISNALSSIMKFIISWASYMNRYCNSYYYLLSSF